MVRVEGGWEPLEEFYKNITLVEVCLAEFTRLNVVLLKYDCL